MKILFYLSAFICILGISCKKDPVPPCVMVPAVAGCYSNGPSIFYLGHPAHTQSIKTPSLAVASAVLAGPSAISPGGDLYYTYSANSSIYAVNTSNSTISKQYYVGLGTGVFFMYHRKTNHSLIIGSSAKIGMLEVRELDLYSGVLTKLFTTNFSAAFARSWMVDEANGKIYYASGGDLFAINMNTGASVKHCTVYGGNFWHFDSDDNKVYFLIGKSYFSLYSLDLGTKVIKTLKEYPSITTVPLGGTAYDSEKNLLVLFDAAQKRLININTKTLSFHSEACTTPLFNLEIAGFCIKENNGRSE